MEQADNKLSQATGVITLGLSPLDGKLIISLSKTLYVYFINYLIALLCKRKHVLTGK